jgi:hypothetical protein
MQQAQRTLYDHELRAIGKRENKKTEKEQRTRRKQQQASSSGPKVPIVNIKSSKHRK